MKIIRSLALTLTIYGFLGWLYIALNQAAHPESLSWPLTHLLPYPREDTAGVLSFFVSMISFFIWNLLRGDAK